MIYVNLYQFNAHISRSLRWRDILEKFTVQNPGCGDTNCKNTRSYRISFIEAFCPNSINISFRIYSKIYFYKKKLCANISNVDLDILFAVDKRLSSFFTPFPRHYTFLRVKNNASYFLPVPHCL